MVRVFAVVAVILLTVYCVVEVAVAKPYSVRNAPRWLWAVAVICLPGIGPITWLFFGRPNGTPSSNNRGNPDDDPDFLRRL